MALRKRRGSGDGSVYRIESGRDKGKWVAQVDLGWSASGQRLRPRKVRATEREAKAALRELLERRDAGVVKIETVHQWLDHWMEHIVTPTMRPQSIATRKSAVVWMKRGIGSKVTLLELAPQHVRAMQATMRRADASRRRILDVTATLGTALNVAIVDRLMVRSPVPSVLAATRKPQRTPHAELTWDQAIHVTDHTADPQMRARLAVSLMAGLRPSEVLGLRWADVDLAQDEAGVWRGEIHIRGQRGRLGQTYAPAKTDRSVRTVPLEPVAAAILAAWHQDAESEWLFPSSVTAAAPMSQNSDRRRWAATLAAAGVPSITPHGARSTFATRLLDQGVSIAVAAALIGDKPETLLRHYARSSRGIEREAIKALEA